MQLGYEYLESGSILRDDEIMYNLQFIIRKHPTFKTFRHDYLMGKRINDTFDILQESMDYPEDIKLVVFQRTDDYVTHCVTAVVHFIFDSNLKNCLPLSEKGLNVICQDKFASIAHGFLFKQNKKPQSKQTDQDKELGGQLNTLFTTVLTERV